MTEKEKSLLMEEFKGLKVKMEELELDINNYTESLSGFVSIIDSVSELLVEKVKKLRVIEGKLMKISMMFIDEDLKGNL